MEKSLVYLSETTRKALLPLFIVVSGGFIFLLWYGIGTALLWTVPGTLIGLWTAYLVGGGEVLLIGPRRLALLQMGHFKVRYQLLRLEPGLPNVTVANDRVVIQQGNTTLRFGEYLNPTRLPDVAADLSADLSLYAQPTQKTIS